MTDIEANASRVLIDAMQVAGMKVAPLDDDLIHIISSMLFSGMFETVRHNMSQEQAIQHMCSLRDFYSAGWFKILGLAP